MAALDFPSSPTLNQTYTANGTTYKWDGTSWVSFNPTDLSFVTNYLTPTNGGTGVTSLTANNVILGNGTSAVQFVAPGTSGNLLTSNGTTWSSAAPPVSMVYPGSGIPNSTGTAWGTSYSTTGTGTVVALATSPSFTTPILGTPTSGNFSTGTFTWPTFNQNTSGTAAGLSATLVATSGGTGQSTYAVGDLLVGGATNTLTKLADVATGNALISGGVNAAPSWGKIGLTTHITGTLGTANGGTNLSSFTLNGAVYATSTSALTTGTLPIASGGTGQTTQTAAFDALAPTTTSGDIIYYNGTDNVRLGIGSTGQALTVVAGAPAWGTVSGMVYPGAGIPNSTGSAWGTSYSTTGSGTVVALATSPVFTTPSLGVASATSLTATGAVSGSVVTASNGIIVNSKTVAASYAIPSGSSAMSTGPITVSSGATVTIPSGSKWVIL